MASIANKSWSLLTSRYSQGTGIAALMSLITENDFDRQNLWWDNLERPPPISQTGNDAQCAATPLDPDRLCIRSYILRLQRFNTSLLSAIYCRLEVLVYMKVNKDWKKRRVDVIGFQLRPWGDRTKQTPLRRANFQANCEIRYGISQTRRKTEEKKKKQTTILVCPETTSELMDQVHKISTAQPALLVTLCRPNAETSEHDQPSR